MNPTVDDILASGRYRDRQGRVWAAVGYFRHHVTYWMCVGDIRLRLTPDQMRLVIERDRHRAECVGLRGCPRHPVPLVVVAAGASWAHPSIPKGRTSAYIRCATLPEAMDAAVQMAKEGR
ncbi:hypothetical protein [Sediminivirga luteola]|uniref:Uncharacterized protein n=1 Tax=Sediminivirga luteola TaxID=1774748 RepID=A0A8J2XK21_9MICO|nr:hypothetical protein [Sediminivirga luteola]GGA10879.1 hypothetical protein GCM10011333_12130 [Sediminivirga luteola]